MAPEKSSSGERTEEATPRRLEEAKKKGQVAKSTDLNAALNLFVILLVIYMSQEQVSQIIYAFCTDFFSDGLLAKTEELPDVLLNGTVLFFQLVFPFFLAAVVIGILSNFVQVGFMFTGETVKPSWERLNLVQGLQKIFSMKTLVELIKNMAKIGIVGFVVFTVVKSKIISLFALGNLDIAAIALEGKKILFSIAWAVLITYLVIAIIDFIYQKYQYKKSMRMTKQEVKDEYKQTEGRPEVKARQREMQRRLSTRRMMEEVPRATVVVTNPTHFAVAIKYERKVMVAPMVVAKGADLIAERIKQVAKDYQVPVIENKPVAQLLYRETEIGDSIPDELFQAVAEILAVIYQKGKKKF